jgi:hypothetical protein
MISLIVEKFSAIEYANIQIRPLTVLIGPQGSGKSVTTKLVYFFADLLSAQHEYAEKGLSLNELKKQVASEFIKWFPPMAWGSNRFNINFSASTYHVRILRKTRGGLPTDGISVHFSNFFASHYSYLEESYASEIQTDMFGDDGSLARSLNRTRRIVAASEKALFAELKESFIDSQYFIPAGRAYFTSIGQIVAAFEQAGNLDPLTIRFAQLYARLRDASSRRVRLRTSRKISTPSWIVMDRLFGGPVVFDKEMDYIEARDGRRIPFKSLSSGQQELLPMWLLVDYFTNSDFHREDGTELFYIEEPEAHLFPEAQGNLLDFLISSMQPSAHRRLLLTTHSPYILSKLNNYIKAGLLSRDRRNRLAVMDVVSEEHWLDPDKVAVYAIKDGHIESIVGDDQLINADYIDSVSASISDQFTKLLDIEFPDLV